MIAGSWSGTFTLPAAAKPVAVALAFHDRTATVSLGPGHASATDVAVVVRGTRVRFTFPGLPAGIAFDGALTAGRITGTVRQGALHGRFTLRLGPEPAVSALGLYRSATGAFAAVVQAEGLPTWLVELPSGAIHGLSPPLATVGPLLGRTSGAGTLAVGRSAITWTHAGAATRYGRVRVRQWEVRIGSIAATLTLPPGPGPFPAAVMVHGSSPAGREEFQVFAAYLESIGVAVLAADKRDVPSAATDSTLALLASDVRAQVDFLAARGDVDPARIGVLGDSQAGWVIALAAARDAHVRWAVSLVGPTATVGETDLFTQLAGAEQSPPSGTRAQMLAQVRAAGPSGFDPLPLLRGVSIPMLWVYGDDDRNVPTELCVERLQSISAGHDFSSVVLHMTHALIDLPTGLYSSLAQSPGFAPALFPAVGTWLSAHDVTKTRES